MSAFKQKEVWLGAAISIVTILALLAAIAALIYFGRIPESGEMVVGCGCVFMGMIPGGLFAVKKEKKLIRSILSSLIVYLIMWVATLTSGQKICFGSTAITLALCLFSGGIVGGMIRTNYKKKSKRTYKSRQKRR